MTKRSLAELLRKKDVQKALPVEATVVAPVIRGTSTDTELAQSRLASIEEGLLAQSAGVVADVVSFADIERGTKIPPAAWIEELGEDGAHRRLRHMQAGWMSQADAPIGAKVAMNVMLGIMKAKSTRDAAPTLNVQIVQLTADPPKKYEDIDDTDLSKPDHR